MHKQPSATSFDVRGEAVRWERVGLQGGVKGWSHPTVPRVSEMDKGTVKTSEIAVKLADSKYCFVAEVIPA